MEKDEGTSFIKCIVPSGLIKSDGKDYLTLSVTSLIRYSISKFPTNARNRLSSISERARNQRAYQAQTDLLPEVTGSPAASVAGSRRPSNASIDGGVMDSLAQSVCMSPERTLTASSAQSNSAARAASASPRVSVFQTYFIELLYLIRGVVQELK